MGDLGALQRARPQGPDDVRPDDRRLVDLHRQPGDRAGHLRDLRRGRAPALRRRLVGQMDPDRGARRHGRRAAARGDDGRRVDARDRVPAVAHRDAAAHRLSRPARELARRGARDDRGVPARRSARCRSDLLGNAAELLPRDSEARTSRRPTPGARDRSDVRARPGERLSSRAAGRSRNGEASASAIPDEVRDLPRASRSPITFGRSSAFKAMGIPCVDYGNNIRQEAHDVGVQNAFDFPGFVPAYVRPLFCRGKGPFRWVALSGDPGGHLPDRREDQGCSSPTTATCTMARLGARAAIKFQGLPARICWLGLGERHIAGLAFNEMVREGRSESADRHRPRPSRFRLGRQPEPRDRSDARRLGRGVRLGAPERAAQ